MHSHWILSNKISLLSVAIWSNLFLSLCYDIPINIFFCVSFNLFPLFVIFSFLCSFLNFFLSQLSNFINLFGCNFNPVFFFILFIFNLTSILSYVLIFFNILWYDISASGFFLYIAIYIGWPYWIKKVYVFLCILFILDCWWCRSVDETFE